MFLKNLFYKFKENVLNIFRGKNLLCHFLAIALTFLLVTTDFDWKYFLFFNGSYLANVLFSAALVGVFVPIFAPIIVLIFGKLRNKAKLLNIGYALAQSAILGYLVSSIYKTFSGRVPPPIAHFNNPFLDITQLTYVSSFLSDTSKIFNFGFLRNGIFWGWPSSHTTVAFAMAVTLLIMYPKNKIIKIFTVVYALYIGIGVSMTIHWFSDFVAGAIIGSVIGYTVGKSFLNFNKTEIVPVAES